MATLRLKNGTTVTVPDEHTADYVSQGLTATGDEAGVTKAKRRRGPRRPRVSAKPSTPVAQPPTE